MLASLFITVSTIEMTTPSAKDLSHLLSVESKSRRNSPLRSAFKYFNAPGMTFLGGGLPLPELFPIENISADIAAAPFPDGITQKVTDENKLVVSISKDKADCEPKDIELARCLQYGYTEGHHELIDFLKEHTNQIHSPPYADWDLIVLAGNTGATDATFRTFMNRGETILVEEHSFLSALETATAQGINTFPVPMDEFGILPEKMSQILDSWIGAKPKLLYIIATGQNPSGSCLLVERRKAVYALAVKHDFIIVEDEPYYFLQMDEYTSDASARLGRHPHNHEEFLKAMVPSFLSMDVEGRVIRLDSFSKVLAPGLRLGFIVGQNKLLERYLRLHEVSATYSGLSLTVTNGLLQKWGQGGYLDWLIALRAVYTQKRDIAVDAVKKHLPSEIISVVPPVAGMFFTVHIDATKHPKFVLEFDSDPIKVETAVYEEAIKLGSLMIPGSWFRAHGQSCPPQSTVLENPALKTTCFFRGTYAAVPEDQLDPGIEKFGKALRIQFGLE